MVSIHRGSDYFTNQLMTSDVRSISTAAVWESDEMFSCPAEAEHVEFVHSRVKKYEIFKPNAFFL